MIYLITTVSTRHDQWTCFNPTRDSEVFGSYFAALRWLACERRKLRSAGYRIWTEVPTHRPRIGRATLFCLCYRFEALSLTRVTISRLTTKRYR